MGIPLAFKIVEDFERTVAEFCGARFGVAVESGTAALFLSLMYRKKMVGLSDIIEIPKFTYPSVPASVIHAGGAVLFVDESWQGEYELGETGIWDAALRFKKGMYHGGLQCLSFHAKKLLPIGRGGMILTDDLEARNWLIRARFDGRMQGVPLSEDDFMLGWNMYMEPVQAARGLQIFDMIKNKNLEDIDPATQEYPDLSKFKCYEV